MVHRAGVLTALFVAAVSLLNLFRSRTTAGEVGAIVHPRVWAGWATYSGPLRGETKAIAQHAQGVNPILEAAGRKIIRTSSLEIVMRHPHASALYKVTTSTTPESLPPVRNRR